jgi:hypothetical protein
MLLCHQWLLQARGTTKSISERLGTPLGRGQNILGGKSRKAEILTRTTGTQRKLQNQSPNGAESEQSEAKTTDPKPGFALPLLTVRLILVASLVVVLASRHAAAQASGGGDAPAAPIATDRPSVTDSSVVVPVGSFQAENGFAETVDQGQRTFDGPETLLRFGVASKTELRLTAPDYFGPVGMGSGFGDLAVGMKQQLGPTRGGFDVSLVLSLSLPTGARAISSHGYDPFVQLPWSRALPSKWTAAGMLSLYWPTVRGRRNLTRETTFLVDRQLRQTWDAFVEYVGDFPDQGGPRNLVHFGTSCRLTPRQQLDLHVGLGLSSAAVDHFIGVGYSFRLQAVRR